MVEEQISARGIKDELVLQAMRLVPRHKFVPAGEVPRAYEDCPLPIGEGQTISQPYMVALMAQCLAVDETKRVFEIGTGSGYQAAVLAQLSREVHTVERVEGLLLRARQTFEELGYANIKAFSGDGNRWQEVAGQSFDAILITAAAQKRPDRLISCLPAGGRLVVPLGDRHHQTLMIFTKSGGHVIEKTVCGCTFVPLIGEYGWPLDLENR